MNNLVQNETGLWLLYSSAVLKKLRSCTDLLNLTKQFIPLLSFVFNSLISEIMYIIFQGEGRRH